MIRRPPRSTRTDTLLPYTTLFRSNSITFDATGGYAKPINSKSSSQDGLSPSFISLDESHAQGRSEEHTSELQSLMRISYAVFCLKKKNNNDKEQEMLKEHDHRLNTTHQLYENIRKHSSHAYT